MGIALGSVVGAGLWSGKVSVMTFGGILGAAFASAAMCPPTGLAAPPGFLMGYAVTYVLRGIVRFSRQSRAGLDLALAWLDRVAHTLAERRDFRRCARLRDHFLVGA